MMSYIYSLFAPILLLITLSSVDQCRPCEVGQWLDVSPQIADADAIVVLGGDAGTRLPIAVELFQSGLAPEIWYTGATEEATEASTAETQQAFQPFQQMVEQGIPAEAITLLATTNTWTDGEQVAATVREHDTHSILVVTSWYHGRRALCSIHHHLKDDKVQVYYQPVDTPSFGPGDWWLSEQGEKIVTRELNKIIFYWGYYGLSPWVC